MKRPAYKEYKKCLAEPGRLIRASALRSYIETTPYRFKYVQIVLFAVFTIAVLLLTYIIPAVSDKTAWDKKEYLLMINTLKFIPLIYWFLVELVFFSDNPFRYLFAGFKQVPEDYFQNKEIVSSKSVEPSYMDILIGSDFPKKIKRKGSKPKNFIYCPDGRVFEEKRFRVYYNIWEIVLLVVYLSYPTVHLFISLTLIKTDTPEYYLYSVFYAAIAVAVLYICIFFIFPLIRWRFNKFEEVSIDEAIKSASEDKQ